MSLPFVQKVLGKGNFGTVSLVTYKGKKAVMKIPHAVAQDPDTENPTKNMMRQIANYKLLDTALKKRPEFAPYFLQLKEHGNIMKPYIILEFVENNITLKQFVNGDYIKYLPDMTVFDIISSILQAIKFLHDSGLIHNDLHEHNILVNPSNGLIKIIDYGEMEKSKNYKTDMIFLKSTIISLLNYKNVIVDKCNFASLFRFTLLGKLFACLTGQDENKSIDLEKFYKVAAKFNHYTFVKKWSVE